MACCVVQVWLSYASFEATPASMLGEDDQEGEGSEAERRQAAAKQEGPAAAADREAHARRSACHTHPQTATETSGMQGCRPCPDSALLCHGHKPQACLWVCVACKRVLVANAADVGINCAHGAG